LGGANHYLFIGNTSTGKSTLLNSLLKDLGYQGELAKTGRGETTMSYTNYPLSSSLTLWDFPGKNDEMSYFNTDYLAILKAVNTCYVLYEKTIKENIELLQFLQQTGCTYKMVLNKIDEWENDELIDEKNIAKNICQEKRFSSELMYMSGQNKTGYYPQILNLLISKK